MTQYDLLRQHIASICPLSDSEWDYVAQHFSYRKLRKHQFLVQKGEMVPCEFWIIKGLVKTYAIDCDGKEHILQFAMEEYWTSDFQAFQNQVPACMYMDCIEDSEVYSISFENLNFLCSQMPKMEHPCQYITSIKKSQFACRW